MKHSFVLCGALLLSAVVPACTGPQGPAGKPGADGQVTPEVSAVTPPFAFLGRTVDLAIAGSATTWSSTTTVAFGDPKVTVNQITAASPTALLVNVTIAPDATVGTTDVTVTDGSTMEVYKGAFALQAPLAVTTDQKGGVPQGGFANVRVQMLDLTTPFDPASLKVTLSASDVSVVGSPAASSYAVDLLVAADILAQATENVDVTVSSGLTGSAVATTVKAAFAVAARTPGALGSGTGVMGQVASSSDSSLYAFTPSSAGTRFVQYVVKSPDMGPVQGTVIPKSGKQADALDTFPVRFGLGTNSADVTYVVVADRGAPSLLASPFGFALTVAETPCTAVPEELGLHDTWMVAQAISSLPALVQGDVLNSPTGAWYKISVGAGHTQIHVASGGDRLSDVSLEVLASDGTTSLGTAAADDFHKDLVVPGTSGDDYYVMVSKGQRFDPQHSTYDLFLTEQ